MKVVRTQSTQEDENSDDFMAPFSFEIVDFKKCACSSECEHRVYYLLYWIVRLYSKVASSKLGLTQLILQ